MLYEKTSLTVSGVRSPAFGGGYFRFVPLSCKRTLTLQSLRTFMCPAYKVSSFITERNSIAQVRGPSHLIALEVIIHN